MCTECAVQTPVGYRCRECVRGIQDKYFNATPSDDALVFGVTTGATALIAGIIAAMNLPLLFVIIVGLPIGGAIGELAIRLMGKRRGRSTPQFGAAGAVVGGIVGVIGRVVLVAGSRVSFDLILRAAFSEWGAWIAVLMIAVAVYGRLRSRG
jgi:hypothetical protein